MPKVLTFTSDDGAVWGVPAEVVAAHRAKDYADTAADGGPGYGSYAETYHAEFRAVLDEEDHSELIDWAEGNMDFNDVREHTVLLEPPKPTNMQEAWTNGDKTVIDSPTEDFDKWWTPSLRAREVCFFPHIAKDKAR